MFRGEYAMGPPMGDAVGLTMEYYHTHGIRVSHGTRVPRGALHRAHHGTRASHVVHRGTFHGRPTIPWRVL